MATPNQSYRHLRRPVIYLFDFCIGNIFLFTFIKKGNQKRLNSRSNVGVVIISTFIQELFEGFALLLT